MLNVIRKMTKAMTELKSALLLNLPKELSDKWTQRRTLIAVERYRKVGNRTSIDTHFYVSSAVITSKAFRAAVRAK